MPTPESKEHSRVSLLGPLLPEMASSHPQQEPLSPIQRRNLFGSGDASDDPSGTDVEDQELDAGPGTKVAISVEGYLEDAYKLARGIARWLAGIAGNANTDQQVAPDDRT